MDLNHVCSKVQQRYFLAVMCSFGVLFTNLNHFSFDLLFKEMFYFNRKISYTPPCSRDADETRSIGKEEFLWGSNLQGHVISGWLYGELLGRFPLALLTDRYGAKTIFGFSIFIPGICSAITPLCSRSSPYLMIGVRVVNGFFASTQTLTQAWLSARWFPLRARGMMLSIVYIGNPLGLILALWIKHIYAHENLSWTAVFYVNGCLSVVFSYFWQLLIWDDPFEHPHITDDELIFLATHVPMYAQEAELQPGWKWPWMSMLKSKCLWILSIAIIGEQCSFSFATYFIPILYFPDVQVYDFTKHESVGTVVFLSMAAGMCLGGVVGDWAVSSDRQFLSITQLTKIYFTCSNILNPLMMIAVVHSECDLYFAMFSFMAAMFWLGFSYSNRTITCLHMAPNFVTTTMALTALPETIVSPVFFLVMTYVIDMPIKSSWVATAYLNALLSVFTTAIYLQYGNVELQPWNEPQKAKEAENDDSVPVDNTSSADVSSKI